MQKYKQDFIETEHFAKFTGKNLLKELRKRKIKTGIISNELKDCILYSLKKHKVKVDIILSSEKTKKAKPHPYLLLKAMKSLRVKPSEALYVGDHPKDIQMGKRAKVKTAALINILHGARRLKREKPTYLIRNINEVLDII
jgi:HAD superfamily hydrolase (TIGR01662 family)